MSCLLSFEGTPLQDYAAPVPDLWASIATRILAVLPFVAVPCCWPSWRGRSASRSLIILFFVADLAVTGAPFWPGSPVPWLPA